MTNHYEPPKSELNLLQAPIHLKGTTAATGASQALGTLSTKVNPLDSMLDFSFEPRATKYVAVCLYGLSMAALIAVNHLFYLGFIFFLPIYAVLILVLSRRVQFHLQNEDVLVDRAKNLVCLRKLRNGIWFELAFKVHPQDLDRLLVLASSSIDSNIKRKHKWGAYLLLIGLHIAILAAFNDRDS